MFCLHRGRWRHDEAVYTLVQEHLDGLNFGRLLLVGVDQNDVVAALLCRVSDAPGGQTEVGIFNVPHHNTDSV
ncbi:hypothetical protein D9M72_360510 [compost metagenome]